MRTLTVLISMTLLLNARGGHTQEQNDYQLKIKPQLCVIETSETACKAPLSAQWLHPEAQTQTLCLYRERQQQALHCDGAQVGAQRANWQADVTSNERIELKNEQAETVAHDNIVVARLVTDIRPRRRYGWSIF